MRTIPWVLLALVLPLLPCSAARGEPVAVRFSEGVLRGFPTVRSLDGDKLALGDFVQVAREDQVESRLTFRFRDGSLYDETVVFSQRGVFRLHSYRLIQRGPSFPEALEASIDRKSGRYHVRYRADEDSPEETMTGEFTLPEDAYNGMFSLILKNLRPGTTEMVSVIAFTPKPRAVKVRLAPVAEDRVLLNDSPMQAVRYVIRPELGLLASLLLVDSPDVRCWILPGDAPAFVKAEGPLYFMGPVWRIEPY